LEFRVYAVTANAAKARLKAELQTGFVSNYAPAADAKLFCHFTCSKNSGDTM
jgi:hypothetical protein